MPSNKPNLIKLKSAGYVYPLYEQRWNLFAPAPITNYHFSYRCRVGKEWGKWIYPMNEYHKTHDKLAFSSSGKHVLAEYNLAYWIHSQLYKDFGSAYTTSLKTLDDQELFKESFAYRSYEKYIRFYSTREDCDGVQGKIDITDLKNGYVHEIMLPEVYEQD
jgi:hypothetical protein